MDRHVAFAMRDGKTGEYDLQGKCPDLKFEGFSWTIPIGTEVCEREQSIRVIQSPQICMLGKFTDVTPAKSKPNGPPPPPPPQP